MLKLLTILIAVGFGIGLNAATAQNVDSDKDKAQGQDKIMRDKEQGAQQRSSTSQQAKKKIKPGAAQSGNTQIAKMPEECSNLSGKERNRCIQATPAGPVDIRTGAERKGKSGMAKERDRAKAENQTGTNAPPQSNSAVGHPEQAATTGEAQTGNGAGKNNPSGRKLPAQSKDTVGHPEERVTTGEAQSGQAISKK